MIGTADLGRTYVVVSRSHRERLDNKKMKKSIWTVTLQNEDDHIHTIRSENENLWRQYPLGKEVDLEVAVEKQTTLAVEQVREAAEEQIAKGN